jgi:hypothetical protein
MPFMKWLVRGPARSLGKQEKVSSLRVVTRQIPALLDLRSAIRKRWLKE